MTDVPFVYEELDKFHFKDEPEPGGAPEDSNICKAEEEIIVFDGTRSKCGDVFVELQGNFTLVCSICGVDFEAFDSFGLHISKCHLWIKSEPEVAMEYTLTESLPVLDATNILQPWNRENTISGNEGQAQLKQEANTIPITTHNSLTQNQHVENAEVKEIIDIWTPEEELDENSGDGAMTSEEACGKTRTLPKRKEYFCLRCCRTYFTKKYFDAHNRRKHKNLDVDDVLRYVEATENTIIDPEKVICKYCDKSFDDQTELKNHISTHTGRNRFECPFCPKKFTSCYNRDSHVNTHTGERPFKCATCSKTFTQKAKLAIHIRIHRDTQTFSSDYCDKRFVQAGEKRVHERTHTGERPYKCDECGSKFSAKRKLADHVLRHKGIRHYKCKECSKEFYTSSTYYYHKQTHTGNRPHQCDECGKRFIIRSMLMKHIKRHTGIKNFKCELCSKAFYSAYELKTHTTSHTGELPFKCDICSKAYLRVRSLRIHQKRHSK